MLINSSGHLTVTVVDGSTLVGIYASDGSLNVFDASGVTTPVGIYHASGAINVTLVDGTTLVGAQAPNGSLYIVNDSAEVGIKHSSGALNVTGFSNAASFLSAYGPYGMVMDFTDSSIAILESSGVLNYNSIGTISSAGAPLGPRSKLTYSAPSVKLTEQEDGYLSFQAHNMILRSEDVSNASWVKTSVTTPSADTVSITNANAVHNINQVLSSAAITGATYEISVEMKAGTWRYVALQPNDGVANGVGRTFDLQTGTITASISLGTLFTVVGTPSITAIGDGWYRCVLQYTHGSSTLNISNTILARVDGTSTAWASSWTPPSGGETFQIRKYHIRRTPSISTYVATTSAAVYDLPSVYSGGDKTGILVEPAATNLFTYSTQFDNAAWIKANVTVSPNTSTAPDGTLTGDLLYPASSGVARRMVGSLTTTAVSNTWSIYAKASGKSWIYGFTHDGSGIAAYFNVSAGSVGTVAPGYTATITAVGNGWYRCTHTGTGTAGSSFGGYIGVCDANGSDNVTANGTDGVLIWGVQLETGTVATSPIITYGSSVLRAIDNLSIATTLFPFNAAAGTCYSQAKMNGYSAAVGPNVAFALHDGTANNKIRLRLYNGATASAFQVVVAGSVDVNATTASVAANTLYKTVCAYAVNDFAIVVDGAAPVTDALSAVPTVNTMSVGLDLSSGSLNGLLTVVAVFPERKANATLQTMTTA